MKRIVLSAACYVGIVSAALAVETPPPPESGTAAAARSANENAAKDKIVGDAMTETLRKAGFTDLQVFPNSVLVRGKDKAGNPVAMVLNPSTMTEVVTIDPHSGPAAGGNGAAVVLQGSSPFVSILPSAKLASILIGLKVRDAANGNLATITDLAIDHDGIQAYILSIGGVLGLGDHLIAVAPSAVTLVYDQVANAYGATMKTDAAQLKMAPEFRYDGAFKAKRD